MNRFAVLALGLLALGLTGCATWQACLFPCVF